MAEKRVIKPTVGRVVYFWPHGRAQREGDVEQPWAALVAFVHNDRCVNLTVFTASGQQRQEQDVALRQPDDDAPPTGSFAEWMPYQEGQAAKTEDVTGKLLTRMIELESRLAKLEALAVGDELQQKLAEDNAANPVKAG